MSKKGADFELIRTQTNSSTDKYLSEMAQYVEDFKAMPPDQQRRSAKKSLVLSGIATSKGTIKKNIVSR